MRSNVDMVNPTSFEHENNRLVGAGSLNGVITASASEP